MTGKFQNKKERDEKVGDVDCFVVSYTLGPIKLPNNMGSSGKNTTKLWIGKQDYLIRKAQTISENSSLPGVKISDSLVKNALAEKNEPATPEAMAAMRAKLEATTKAEMDQLKSTKFIFTETHENILVNQVFPASDFAQ